MKKEVNTKRRLGLVLFGAIFFFVGLGFLVISVIPTLYDVWRMQSWPVTQAELTYATLDVKRSSDSTTYQARAKYRYIVQGQEYQNDRVAINSGGDNIGDFQSHLGRSLQSAYQKNRPVTVFYNPDNPSDALLNRNLRWGLLGFKAIFVIIFGGLGGGLMIWAYRGKRRIETEETSAKPWLARPEWENGKIRSDAKIGMFVAIGIAIFWNLVSAPAAFQFQDVWHQKGTIALFLLLFPLVGVGLIYWAIKSVREWRRFGVTPLTMDPFPGAIGGDVGGEIATSVKFATDLIVKVTLSSIYRYTSGSGKNRSTREDVNWQEEGYAKVLPRSNGSTFQFRFEVPTDLPASEESSNAYNLWRLNVSLQVPGTDLDRSFEIPVYNTAEKSRRIAFKSIEIKPRGIPDVTPESLMPLTRSGNDIVIQYSIFRKFWRSVGVLLFGSIFAGAGVFMWIEAARSGAMLYMMSSIFSLVGWGIIVAGLYSALNSLRVHLDGLRITSTRSLLGLKIQQQSATYTEINQILAKRSMRSSNGRKHKIEYRVCAESGGRQITLAEHIDSARNRDKVIAYFEQEILGRQR